MAHDDGADTGNLLIQRQLSVSLQAAVSPSLLLYDPAPPLSQFAWVDRNGKVLHLVGEPAPFGFYRTPAGKLMTVSLKMDKHSAEVSTPREFSR
jgi:hypothetical protein